MPNKRKQLVNKFINEGFTHRTLSLFSDIQLKELHKKIFKEAVSAEAAKNAQDVLIKKKEEELATLKDEMSENDTTEEELDIETDPTGNPKMKIDGEDLLVELPKEMEEDFASKAQQKYLYAVNPAAAEKLASKMTKKDYEDLPEYVNQDKMLEEWILKLVESKERPEITKGNFIKTIKENLGKVDSPYIVGTEAQQEAFANVVEIGNEMVPPMNVNVDSFDDGGHLNGHLNAPENEQVIELNICPEGDIKLDGNPVGGLELTETDRDDDGEYIGAPEATTAPVKPAPVKPATRPGEKTRRGPFEKPKTTPKPKARKNDSLPDWLSATNLGKSLTQHG